MSEPVKDYEVTIKIRNNHLLKAIRDAGYKSMAHFAKACNLTQQTIQLYAALKLAPLTVYENGQERWKQSILDIADALNTVPENLFPAQHLRKQIKNNTATIEATVADVEFILEQRSFDIHRLLSSNALKEKIVRGLAILPDRDAKIMIKLYGLDGEELTLEEVAKEIGVSRERIRQIEMRSLWRLSHPSKGLRQFLPSPKTIENAVQSV